MRGAGKMGALGVCGRTEVRCPLSSLSTLAHWLAFPFNTMTRAGDDAPQHRAADLRPVPALARAYRSSCRSWRVREQYRYGQWARLCGQRSPTRWHAATQILLRVTQVGQRVLAPVLQRLAENHVSWLDLQCDEGSQ